MPTNIVAASVITFDSNDGVIFQSGIGGPYQLQIVRKIAVFDGNYSPSPTPINPIPPLPDAADPPFPPVWGPYPTAFSTSILYGREGVGVINLLVRGDTYVMDLTAIQDSSDNALDLTGATLTMTAKFNVTDDNADALFELTTTGGGIVITDATAGEFTVTIPPAATLDCPFIKTIIFYDIQYSLSGTIYTILRGQLIVVPDITAG